MPSIIRQWALRIYRTYEFLKEKKQLSKLSLASTVHNIVHNLYVQVVLILL